MADCRNIEARHGWEFNPPDDEDPESYIQIEFALPLSAEPSLRGAPALAAAG
jgi:hypothetical protein